MTAFDRKFAALATKMTSKFGKVIRITSNTEGAYDPATGQVSASTSTTQTLKSAPPEPYGMGDVYKSGGLIKMGDERFMIASAGITAPNLGDILETDGINRTILAVLPIWSGEAIAAYELQVRR